MIRVIDSGLADAQTQMAQSAALIETASPVLRFFRFPPSLLIGLHQPWPDRVPPGVAAARRPTGGGTIYVDEGQLCWEIVAPLRALGVATLAEASARIGTAAARGLGRWARVRFTPPNSLTAAGRKLCGMAGLIDRNRVLCQASLLIEGKPETIAGLSGVPEAAAGLTTLADQYGQAPDLPTVKAALTEAFETLFATERAHAV